MRPKRPTIDADLSDPAWAKATVIDNFTQKQPIPYTAPTERTVLRILYDENNLYFAFYNYDSTPDAIIARSMQRDGPLFTADSVMLLHRSRPDAAQRLQFRDRRLGRTHRSARAQQHRRAARVGHDLGPPVRGSSPTAGWPSSPSRSSSLSYDPGQTIWGFDVGRRIRHKNERVCWSGYNPALDFTDVSQSGDLIGIENVNHGFGLDVQVYGALRAKHDWQLEATARASASPLGGNAFYKITPALTDTLTVNPDFSDAPLDRAAGQHDALLAVHAGDARLLPAGRGGVRIRRAQFRPQLAGPGSNNGRPFFSRNIGLVQGRPVSLVVGDKLSGECRRLRRRRAVGPDRQDADRRQTGRSSRSRASTHPIFGELKVGFIVTNGDPTGQTTNTVAGVDFQYRNSNFLGDKILQADVYYRAQFLEHCGRRRFRGAVAQLSERAVGRRFPFQADRRELPARARLHQPDGHPAI